MADAVAEDKEYGDYENGKVGDQHADTNAISVRDLRHGAGGLSLDKPHAAKERRIGSPKEVLLEV